MISKQILKRALAGVAVAGAIALWTAPAEAQRIDRIVAFGDSYADTGNAFALGYANPSALAVYPTGRFSGGTNYIDTLSTILGAPIEDFAIGGAFGGSNNGTLCFDPFYAPGTSPLCGKGLQYEVDQFLNVGAQSTVFPNGVPSFGPSDLLTVSIGGNDARFYQQVGGTLAGAPAAGTAAAAVTSVQIDRLVAAGAPTISFLAGDTGRLPEVAAFPTLAQIRSTYSAAFNTAMQSTLAGYAQNGVIVHYLDLNLALGNVLADPAAYGFTNGVACPAFPNTTCLLSSNGYLFYGDGLHLTSQGFALVAKYVATQLQAPLTLEAPSELGLDTGLHFGRTLTSRMDLGGPRDGSTAAGLRFFVAGDTYSRDLAPDSATDRFEIRSSGGTVGVEYGFGSGVVGIAGNYSRPKASFVNGASRTRTKTWQGGAYASFGFGGAFAQAYAGYGNDDPRIRREGVLVPMTASPNAHHWLAGAKAGYLLPMGPLQVGPVIALDYAKARVGRYTEDGDPALTLNVGSVSAKALEGSIGAEIRGNLTAGGAGIRPFASALLQKDLTGDGRTVTFAQTSAPTIVNSWQLDDRSKQVFGRLSAGASAALVGNLSIDALASTTVHRHGGNETSANIGLKIGF